MNMDFPNISHYLNVITNTQRRRRFLLKHFNIRFAPELTPFPKMVLIDTTTRCNLKCKHCPSSTLSNDKDWVGDMDVSLFKKIVTEIAHESKDTVVRPFDGGEPLMRKDIADLIGYTKASGVKHVSINTNGTLLSKKTARALLESGLDHIEISLDAFSQETFKKLKNVNAYQKVVTNIENLIAMKNQDYPGFKISLSFVKQKVNLHEVDAFHACWSKKVDHVNIREIHHHGNLIDGQGQYKRHKRNNRHPCPYLWNRMIIQHNGDVRFCENDWKAEHKLGNVQSKSLKEIWHSTAYNALRQSHVVGTFDHPFCKKCPDWEVII